MTKTPETPAGDITQDLDALRRDIAQLSATLSAMLQSQAEGATQKVSGAVEAAKSSVSETATDVASRVRAAGGEIEAGIERNPVTAVLITFAVGMVLGMLSRSRH